MHDNYPITPRFEHDVPIRLEYGAVPLDAWSATDLPTTLSVELDKKELDEKPLPYVVASLRRITEKAHRAVFDAIEYGWASPPDAPGEQGELSIALAHLIETSLYDSHMQRVDRNSHITVADDIDPRLVKAKAGTATPSELLAILADYPEIGSIELAKLSHPLDSTASKAMDEDVYEMLTNLWGEMIIDAPKYKMKTMRADIPAATVLRKQSIGLYETEMGMIEVVCRQSFLVRADEAAKLDAADPYLDRRLRNHEWNMRSGEDSDKVRDRHQTELFPAIEEMLHDPKGSPRAKWLQPLATSYYAKNLSTAVKHGFRR